MRYDAKMVLLIIALTSLFTIILMWHDKRAAQRGGWRIPEASFFMLALFGGSIALIVMMQQLRHKTAKGSFKWRAYAIIPLQILLLFAYWLFMSDA